MSDTKHFETEDGLQMVFDTVNRYSHTAVITAVKGLCPYGHQVGDRFTLTGMNHDCLCGSFYQQLQSSLMTLEYGGGVPWEQNPNLFTAICPERGTVQVEITRQEQEKPVYIKTRTDARVMIGKGFPQIDKYRVYLEILGVENICMWKHCEGERFEVDPFNIGKCCGALYKMAYPFINLLLTGGSVPWEGETHIIHGTCPDPYDLVTYRLIREER